MKKHVQRRNYDLVQPEFSFDIIDNALNVEGYLRRSRDRFVELIWKNGYDIIGKNPRVVSYVQRRFKEIAKVTEKPTQVLFEEISEGLVLYYNAFVYKQRSLKSSSGRPRRYFNKILKPVAGYFILEPSRISAVVNKDNGKLLGWEYEDTEGIINKEDVIHFYMGRPAGKIYGEPPVLAVLDDIRALRRMEENVELLVFQYAIPLYQYKIGTDEHPCTDETEISAAASNVQSMMAQGMLVTPHRHDIKAIGVAREALNVKEYLEYFKERILTTLGQSTISLGESGSASRATATILIKAVLDAARRFQKTLKTFIDFFIIEELLEEGGFNIFDENNKVEIIFPEIDLDDKVRREFHALALYQGNLLEETEARKEIGRGPIKNRKETYFELITKPKAIIQARDEQLTPQAVSNKEAPQNQYGTKKVGPKARSE
ncbi:MAG: hypothetical protein ACTSVB_07845 [Candidatus Heimdallarchaeaceae archaeon]